MPPLATSGSGLNQTTGRKSVHFVLSLLLAIIIWLFNSLSSNYKSDVVVQLNYQFAPGITNTGNTPRVATVHVQSKGWQLLQINLKTIEVEIDVSGMDRHGTFISNLNKDLFKKTFPPGFEILSVSPDSIFFQFEEKVSMQVPVTLKKSITFKNEFGIIDSIQLLPDSITITGPISHVRQISYWETETIYANQVDQQLKGTIALRENTDPSITLSAVAIGYKIPVGKPDTIKADSSFINLHQE